MDDSWQLKCGWTLQSSMPMSSTSHESRNQMDISSGHFFHPHTGNDLRSQAQGWLPNPSFPSSTNLSSYSLGQADLGNSFLALLSMPTPLLKCDFNELPNPKPISTCSKFPVDSNIAVAGRNLLTSSGLLSENVSYQNLQGGVDHCPVVSPRTVVRSNSSRNSILQYGLQVANFNHQHSDLANENTKALPYLRGEWPSTTPGSSVKLQNTNTQIPQKMPLQPESTISDNSCTFTCGCPRVLCLGTSGNLLVSNTGLLGILCSCHCFHMSVSKFCEHSGLWNVNPGDAVHMESGETIAQWRRLYFQKFGIRVPEDQSGWDWPEGLSLTASLVKSSVSMPMTKSSDCNHLVGPSGGVGRSRQQIDSPVFPKNSLPDENSVTNALHNKQQRNGQDGIKFLGLVGNLQRNSLGIGDYEVTDCPIPRCSTRPMFGRGAENSRQSISAYVEDIMKTKNLSTANHTLQNLSVNFNNSDVSRAKDEMDCVIVDKDTNSSSIELRLGQPKQQSRKSLSQKQMIHYVTSSGGKGGAEESRQCLPCAAGLPNSTTIREQDQSNYGRHAVSNAVDVAKVEKLKGDMAKTSVVSPLGHINEPPVGNTHSRVTNNFVNISEHIIPQTVLHCESHAIKCNPVNIPWNGGNGLGRQRTVPEFNFLRPADKGKGVGCPSNSYDETDSGSKIHKWVDNPSSFVGVVGGSSYSGFPAVHDNNCYHHFSSVPPEARDAGSLSNYLEKATCFESSGHIDHVFHRSKGLTMGSEQFLPSQTVPIGFPSSTSTSIQGLTTGLLKQDGISVGPYLLDDNLRLLALRQIVELSKQQHVMSSLGRNLEERRCDNHPNIKIQHSPIEPSASEEQRHGSNLTGKLDVSEVSLKPVQFDPTNKMSNDVDKFSPFTGLNNCCNFSTLTQGMPLHCKEIDIRCQISLDPLRDEQSSIRFRRSENITHSNDNESCCQMASCCQRYCRCASHKKCLGQCKLNGENPPNPFSEQMGIATQLVKDQIIPKETTISVDQCGNLKTQLPKNITSHTSQWKDVPCKINRVCEVASVKQSADIFDGRGHQMDILGDTAVRCSRGPVHMTNSFKEQETSDISFGCSNPVGTRASIEVNNMDSSTVVAGNTGFVSNFVVDEGSGIDKCWSSDDALDSDRSADFYGSTCKTSLRKDGSSKIINNQSSRSLLDEVKLMDSLTWKKGRNQIHTGINVHEKPDHSQESEKGLNGGKRKREMKLKVPDSLLGTTGPGICDKYPQSDGTAESLSKDVQLASSGQETFVIRGIKPSFKRKKSALSEARPLSHKRDLWRPFTETDGEGDYERELNNNVNSCISGRKRLRSSGTFDGFTVLQTQEPIHAGGEKTMDYDSVSYMKACSSQQENVYHRKARPIVCGKYGEISDGKMSGDMSKPVKIVSLDSILKHAKRCMTPKKCKSRPTFQKDLERKNVTWRNGCFDKLSKLRKGTGSNYALACEEMNLQNSVKKREGQSASSDKQSGDEFLEKERDDQSGKSCSNIYTNPHTHSKTKFKEIRSRSLYELTSKGKNSSYKMLLRECVFKCAKKMKVGQIVTSSKDSKCHKHGSRKVSSKRYIQEQMPLSITDSDSFCCVCGSSSNDELNCLLECGQCLIRVHQACYGVSKVPKVHWYCRPCRTNSKNIVCVLCGYGGGAMTQAIRSRTIVKSLLKVWSSETECTAKNAISAAGTWHDELSTLHSSGSVFENNPYPVLRHVNIEPSPSSVCNMDTENRLDILQNSLCCVSNLKVCNSITTGVLDSTIKQWVHMVCGLWTPGTRCPNVDTMSTFDVSGVSRHSANMVCSLCNRPGGTCIQCRVVNCSIQFHPWCAHRQSEVEGVDHESVGFYGRCALHAAYPTDESACDATNIKNNCPGEKEESCARTEGYKGRKRDGFWHNLHGQSKGKGGCLVPQEQLNAWIHINGQKSCTQGLSKLPISDMEHDCRKEYARYKQSKGWKHLVVYKSGIHALGLYTSRFISRGEMVVEYVGEIVGLRVADKRENEYQSGRKLQYKSACYFFRIDKEHIIDATQKGGIARFVNHSCLPNCVAKVISVRNEKKVVFFAERDIYPGEEITYDYHFNHEDEGKKIPCFCNSKNCRRYLN